MANRFATRGVVVRGRGPRRSTQWLGSAKDTGLTVLAANANVLDQSFAFLEPATIVRTRGTLWVFNDVNTAQTTFGAFGMAVVDNAAAAIGITAVPKPSTNSSDDAWFLIFPWLAAT